MSDKTYQAMLLADLLETIADAVKDARREALEEAAKAIYTFPEDEVAWYNDRPHEWKKGYNKGLEDKVAAIRALAERDQEASDDE